MKGELFRITLTTDEGRKFKFNTSQGTIITAMNELTQAIRGDKPLFDAKNQKVILHEESIALVRFYKRVDSHTMLGN